jgi:small-conductance mechanosensitive channel
MSDYLTILETAWSHHWVRVAVIMLVSIALAGGINAAVRLILIRLTKDGERRFDSDLVAQLRQPIYLTVIVTGAYLSLHEFQWNERIIARTDALLVTFLVIIWTMTGARVGSQILGRISDASDDTGLIQPRTVNAFELLLKITVWAFGIYLVFLVWHVDLTAWLASAGVVGIALGFAAKDSLANLIAGVSILADTPFNVGDHIRFEDGVRGRITAIGIRSTRILTPDEIEIVIPNGLISNSRVINESGGPGIKHRIRVEVSVAYGSKVNEVREVLEGCGQDVRGICSSPAPRTFFRSMGDSGLQFELLVWLETPVVRERVLDRLNTLIYERLNEQGIEIPYPKLDLYVRDSGTDE